MINFLLCTVLSPGASEVDQARKFDDFVDLTSDFRFDWTVFWLKWMMSTMLFRTTLNNITNSRKCTVFSLGAAKVDQKRFFLQNGWIFPTLEALWRKTVYPRDFDTNFKIVHNVVYDNFYFDQNTVRSNLKKLCKI